MQAGIVQVWLLTVAASMVWTVIDVVRHANRAMPIMNVVWPLLALYFGPVGLGLYLWLSGRTAEGHPQVRPVMPAPAPALHPGGGHGGRDAAMQEMAAMENAATMPGMMAMGPLWQRALRSSTHCAAGCALGDLVAMVLVEGAGILGGTMMAEAVTGSVLAFLFGLFVFQALPVMAERHMRFRDSLSLALRADVVTIGAYLVGQLIALFVLADIVPMGMGLTPVGFVVMQAAMAAGFLTTYPANYALVAAGIKEGM